MKIENCYISSNCNPTPTIVHWGKNNLICYGSCNSTMIYDPDYGCGGRVIQTLTGHTKRVNSVKWLSGCNIIKETELISGSSDCTIRVWSLKEDTYKAVTLEHSSDVCFIDGLYKENDRQQTVLVSIAIDCYVRVWLRKFPIDDFRCSQTLDLGYSMGLGAKLSFLPNSNNELILACSLGNSKIQMFVEKKNSELLFEPSCLLEGDKDWVHGLDFTQDGDDLLLVYCSQEGFIHIWRISSMQSDRETLKKNEKYQIISRLKIYNVHLESILSGHEGWIYSVYWNPKNLQLLSASIDKSMIIWEFDKSSGLWLEKIRVGEVGGNTLGFYGGIFSPSGNRILAHSYHGAFHIWQDTNKGPGGWSPCVTVGGHFSEVVDCSWAPQGEYLLTVGTDKTTRIHAPWKKGDKEATWHEIARPQVHGYDMSCLAVLSKHRFISGAEEKVIRIFEAPKNFIENFERLCGLDDQDEKCHVTNTSHFGPKGASVPSLGLSNKAVYTDDNIDQASSMDKKNPYPEESHFQATEMIEPPTEQTLIQNTLWPETQKLYGHGYEVYSLAASPDGKYLASACRSTKPEHAAVLLWDTSNWQQIQKLLSHTLTVVQLQFSPDSNHLLSVSRDRRWSLFSKNENDEFKLVATTDKKTAVHSRIIWSCCWSHDSKYFATGSRDGKVVVWLMNRGKEITSVLGECEVAGEYLELPGESVTAVAFAPCLVSGRYFIALGLDSGHIHFYGWCPKGWQALSVLSESAHHLTVRRLAFRPLQGMARNLKNDKCILQLASCSSDFSVRIHNICVEQE